MDFSLSDEQQMLQDTTRRFVASEYGFEHRAGIIASADGWSRDTWRQLADLGLLAVDIPEEEGGIGAGPVGVMLVSQAIGEGLLVEPFVSSAVIATQAIVRLGSAAQRQRWLPALAGGELIAVLVHDDAAPVHARRDGDGWVLQGRLAAIYHAPAAGLLLVSARIDDGGVALFALPADTEHLRVQPFTTVDGQRAANLVVDGVRVTDAMRLGGGDARDALELVVDAGIAALCADAVGTLDRLLKATIDYSRTRRQFGAPIGSFQALQHRMADMLMHVEQARSMMTLATSRCLDSDAGVRRAAVSGAKVLVGQAARFVGQQAVQLHGGMGMTDELDVSHCFKRLLAFELRMGTTDAHLEAVRRMLVAA